MLTVKQFAARFNLPLSSTYDMVRAGKITAVRINGRIRIEAAVADAYARGDAQTGAPA
jgi:excisionase family DNA binding protein